MQKVRQLILQGPVRHGKKVYKHLLECYLPLAIVGYGKNGHSVKLADLESYVQAPELLIQHLMLNTPLAVLTSAVHWILIDFCLWYQDKKNIV